VVKKGYVTLWGKFGVKKILYNLPVMKMCSKSPYWGLQSSIMDSVNHGFPTAPKWIQAAGKYLFTWQISSKSKFVNAIILEDIIILAKVFFSLVSQHRET
jgi:hypothetical protein